MELKTDGTFEFEPEQIVTFGNGKFIVQPKKIVLDFLNLIISDNMDISLSQQTE